jgi:iron complex outermembrane recepter protein
MKSFKLSVFSAAVFMLLGNVNAQTTSDVGKINIVNQNDIGLGLMEVDDGVKGRGSVNRNAIQNNVPGANVYQQINLLPGVNAYAIDPTGMWGGGLRVRGFNSDQMGFTVNGAPVNDSGNFAVYPQEYADTENLCEIFITQGSADTDAPHVGASGGNIGLITCPPNDVRGGKIAQTFGSNNLSRTFARYDSGKIGEENPGKFFISFSHSQSNKFKGPGNGVRDHLEFGSDLKLTSNTTFTQTFIYNQMLNNFYQTLSKAQFASDPNQDYSPNPPSPSQINGASPSNNNYYGYSINPFRNVVYSAKVANRVDENLTLSIEPYYWWGFGNGGGTSVLDPSSSSASNGGNGTIVNPYGGSTKFLAYTPSVTKTQRPGVYLKANWVNEQHNILGGIWYERANHRQTKPGETVDSAGNISDIYAMTPGVFYSNGAPYQGRDQVTMNTATSYFLQDTYLASDRLNLFGGIKYTSINRDFTNFANSGASSVSPQLNTNFSNSMNWGKVLPSIGATYKLDGQNKLFTNVTMGMRAPSYYSQADIGTGSNTVQAETSTTFEVGHRYNGNAIYTSATVFLTNFQNRLANGYNPDTQTYTDYNLGATQSYGLEAQIGTKPSGGFSYYGSATLMRSTISDNFMTSCSGAGTGCSGTGAQVVAPTSGNNVPDTPNVMFGAAAQYSQGPFMAQLSGKYTGMRYTTLMNDESLDPYFTLDFTTAYKLSSSSFFKNPTFRFNATNILNASYQVANIGSGSSIALATGAGSPYAKYNGYSSTLYYYNAAPRFFSVSFSTEF